MNSPAYSMGTADGSNFYTPDNSPASQRNLSVGLDGGGSVALSGVAPGHALSSAAHFLSEVQRDREMAVAGGAHTPTKTSPESRPYSPEYRSLDGTGPAVRVSIFSPTARPPSVPSRERLTQELVALRLQEDEGTGVAEGLPATDMSALLDDGDGSDAVAYATYLQHTVDAAEQSVDEVGGLANLLDSGNESGVALREHLVQIEHEQKELHKDLTAAAEMGMKLLRENKRLRAENIHLTKRFDELDTYASQKENEASMSKGSLSQVRDWEGEAKRLRETTERQRRLLNEAEHVVKLLEEDLNFANELRERQSMRRLELPSPRDGGVDEQLKALQEKEQMLEVKRREEKKEIEDIEKNMAIKDHELSDALDLCKRLRGENERLFNLSKKAVTIEEDLRSARAEMTRQMERNDELSLELVEYRTLQAKYDQLVDIYKADRKKALDRDLMGSPPSDGHTPREGGSAGRSLYAELRHAEDHAGDIETGEGTALIPGLDLNAPHEDFEFDGPAGKYRRPAPSCCQRIKRILCCGCC